MKVFEGVLQSLWRIAQLKFGNSEFMQIWNGNLKTPAGIYKAIPRHSHTVSAVRNFWPSATGFKVLKVFVSGFKFCYYGYGYGSHFVLVSLFFTIANYCKNNNELQVPDIKEYE